MPQINRTDMSTSAGGADVFTITQAGARFTNLASLGTSGDLASPIRVAAAGVTVRNQGDLSTTGDGSPGITVGDAFGMHYDQVTIANYGSITASGFVFDDGASLGFADGIDVFGNFASVTNFGRISSTGDAVGIFTVGMGSTIVNRGTIDVPLAGIVNDQIDGNEIHNSVDNYGQIHTSFDFSRGIWFLVGDNSAQNFGTITADGFHSYGIYMEGDRNQAVNFGTILATGDEGRGVALQGEDLSLANWGTIRTTGADSIGVRIAGENQPGTDSGTFVNHGDVESPAWAVLGADSNDFVANYGRLAGTVDLGNGDDIYVAGQGGRLDGTLILGEGNDLIICEHGCGALSIGDFSTGAGSDDVFDLSGFGFSSLDEVLAHATQSGADVRLSLGGHDLLTLQDTSLSSLSAEDFLFGSGHGGGVPHFGLGHEMAHSGAAAIV